MANVGSGAAGKTLIGAGNGASPTFASIGTNSGLTSHGVLIGKGNAAFAATAVGSDGQILVGKTLGDPAFSTLTSSDGSISFTVGANTLSMQVASGTTVGKTITGDSGGALSPTAGNWTLAGSGSITTSGSGSTLTTALTGLTNHAVLVGAGTSTMTKLAVGSNGQVLVGSSAADPVFATLTSSDSSISFTTGAGTLSLQVASGTTVGKTITGDSGGALSPTAGNWTLAGSGSITTSGSGSTLTTALTGLTNHALLVGAGTATITKLGPTATAGQVLQSAGSLADPAFSTATYPATATGTGTILRADGTNWSATTSTYPNTNAVSTLLYASSSNVMAALATANDGLLVTSNTGVPSILAGPGTTGNILQSNAAAAPSFSTATYPATATGTGTILRADGTNWSATTSTYPNTNAVNTLLYASSANVMAALATANSGVLSTSASGVPSIDTTNFAVLSTGLQLKGNNTNTAPPAGFIGEVISSVVDSSSKVNLTSTVAANITSVSLTAGIWNVNGIITFGGGTTITERDIAISANSASFTGTTVGDTRFNSTIAAGVYSLICPAVRLSLSSTTTYYLVASSVYTGGTDQGYGKISATRVG